MNTNGPSDIQIQYYKTCCGELMLGSYAEQLCLCDWRYRKAREAIDTRIQKGLQATYAEQDSDVIQKAISQLDEYFAEKRTTFDLPLLFVGTDFQKKVWNALLQVPYGKTDTYAGLAERLNNRTAIRAVASANGANSISIIVPCHRIIGSNRQLIGYAGGLQAKEQLLRLEHSINEKQTKLF